MSAKSTSRRKPAAEDAPPAATEAPSGTTPESSSARPAVRRVSKKIATHKPAAQAPSSGGTRPLAERQESVATAATDPSASEVRIEVVHEPAVLRRHEMAAPPAPVDRPDDAPADSGWPEPETVGAGGDQEGGSKRKRRRRKGKGKGQQPGGQPGEESPVPRESTHSFGQPAAGGESTPAPRPVAHQPRVMTDPDLLAKFAWKIYLAEVSEEGIALINDREAREVARRCFKLAEIFLEEQGRQTGGR
ncbi:MAG: hypothetical protein MUF04_04095 [Akkermansiaceae bacterium]|jgi:hypothetical protein|nr:hypothetical protein [Akkermansiaceae bacterium]